MTEKEVEIRDSGRVSRLISAIRFPLVVFIHTLPNVYVPIERSFSLSNIYVFISELISHNLARIAVPAFFAISGFLFYKNLEGKPFLFFYKTKLESRFWSLLVPFIVWNGISYLAIVIKNYLGLVVGIEQDSFMTKISSYNLYNIFWSDDFGAPLNYPLWYLRDLICVSFLAPVFYWAVNIFKRFTPLIFLLLFVSNIESNVPGLSSTAICFFGIGSYAGINRIDFVSLFDSYKKQSLLIAVALLLVSTFFNSSPSHEYFVRCFIPFGIIAVVIIINNLISNEKTYKKLNSLSETVFFIYCVHTIYIINWTKGVVAHLGTSPSASLVGYFIIPVLTILVSYYLYVFLKKYFPGIVYFCCGKRKSSSAKRIVD